MEKICKKCNLKKKLEFFVKNKKSKDGYRNICKACMKIYKSNNYYNNHERELEKLKIYREKNKEKLYNYNRKVTLKQYSISIEIYNNLLIKQNGVCFICNNPPQGKHSNNKLLNVDHDHITGKVRGLLCQKCNRALGLFNDDINLLKQAVDYLDSKNK